MYARAYQKKSIERYFLYTFFLYIRNVDYIVLSHNCHIYV